MTSTAVRLLAVRGYAPQELRAAVVEVVDRLSPSARPAAVVPPAGVLVAWLVAQELFDP